MFDNLKKAWDALTNKATVTTTDDELAEWLGISKEQKLTSEGTYLLCLRVLSEAMGKMPIKYFQETEKGKIRAEPNNLSMLFSVRPNAVMTPTSLWTAVEWNRQEYGNAYVWLRRRKTRSGYIYQDMWLLPSSDVQVLVDNAGIFADKGNMYYQYIDAYSHEMHVFPSQDVMHFKTSLSYNGILGMPVREMIGELIEGAKSAQDYSTSISKSGMTGMLTLEYTEELDKGKRDKLRAKYKEYLADSRNTNGVIPLPAGLKLVPISMKLADAQFYDLRKYTALQVAAAFGVKPNQLNNYDKNSYSSSEHQQLAFLVETMSYILKGYEEEINYKTLTSEQIKAGYFFRFNEQALLRIDSKTQCEILRGYVNDGIYMPNEARDKLMLPWAEGGDVLMVNGNYIPITMVGQQYGGGETNETT